jgi:hypothetical protein
MPTPADWHAVLAPLTALCALEWGLEAYGACVDGFGSLRELYMLQCCSRSAAHHMLVTWPTRFLVLPCLGLLTALRVLSGGSSVTVRTRTSRRSGGSAFSRRALLLHGLLMHSHPSRMPGHVPCLRIAKLEAGRLVRMCAISHGLDAPMPLPVACCHLRPWACCLPAVTASLA